VSDYADEKSDTDFSPDSVFGYANEEESQIREESQTLRKKSDYEGGKSVRNEKGNSARNEGKVILREKKVRI
jgi:hypothetical protein